MARASLVAALGLLLGCAGAVGDEDPDRDMDPALRPAGSPSPAPGPTAACASRPPSGVLRHLTREEYDNTVRDLLGDGDGGAASFPPDLERGGFQVGAGISPLLVQSYLESAERLAERARPRLRALAGCGTGNDRACGHAFAVAFGTRAYRRPPTTAEAEALQALYDLGAAAGGPDYGLSAVVQGALSAPQFYYHAELDPGGAAPGSTVRVTGYDAAARLSYFLWRSMPDDILFERARSRQLETREQVAMEAARLLAHPRARASLRSFVHQWLELGKLPKLSKDRTLFPFASGSGPALAASLDAFVEHVVWQSDGTLDRLMRSPSAFVDARVAPFFNLPAGGAALAQVELPAAERVGLLTHPAVLGVAAKSNQSDPVLRGKLVREQFLCESLPPPPPEVDTSIPEPKPGQSTRQRFARHATAPACGGCHQMIDPIGFGLEAYDAVGRFRREDAGLAVDVTGRIVGAGDAAGEFEGAPGLVDRLLGARHFRSCFAEQLLRYAVSEVNADEAGCDLAAVAGGRTIVDMLGAVTATSAFSTRTVSVDEGKAP